MTLREATLAKQRAEKALADFDITPLDLPDYANIEPGCDEAKAIAQEWQPHVYGYGSMLAEEAVSELMQIQKGPLHLLEEDGITPLRRGKLARFYSGRYWDLEARVKEMADSALFNTVSDLSVSRRRAATYTHLEQLLVMFHQIGNQDGKREDRFSSPRLFLRAGLFTATEICFRFNRLAGNVAPLGTTPREIHRATARSSFPSSMATLSIRQAAAAVGALHNSERQYDTEAFAWTEDRGGAMVQALVPLKQLFVPSTCKRAHGAFDFSSATTVGDLEKGADPRKQIGCLALLRPAKGGPSALQQYEAWIQNICLASGVWELQMKARQGPTRDTWTLGDSVAAAMIGTGACQMPDVLINRQTLAASLSA